MKKLIQLCLAATLALGASAHATIIDNSRTVDMSDELSTAGSFGFSRTIDTAVAALGEGNNRFSDRYEFSLTAPSYAAGQLTSVLFDDLTGLQISSFNLYKDGIATAVYEGVLFEPVDQTWLFSGSNVLTSGKYFLQVNGYATYTNASYSGTLSVSAVPEPGSLALMLGGLAVLGFAVRRRA